jgi:hypothetical protein
MEFRILQCKGKLNMASSVDSLEQKVAFKGLVSPGTAPAASVLSKAGKKDRQISEPARVVGNHLSPGREAT